MSAGLKHHDSAASHIDGSARYIDDIPEIAGTLHAAPILSKHAHGSVVCLHVEKTLASPHVLSHRGV